MFKSCSPFLFAGQTSHRLLHCLNGCGEQESSMIIHRLVVKSGLSITCDIHRVSLT